MGTEVASFLFNLIRLIMTILDRIHLALAEIQLT